MRVLLALSADGLSVTPVDQYGFRKLPTAKITGDPADTIDGANRGRDIDYHLYGPPGSATTRVHPRRPRNTARSPMDVAVIGRGRRRSDAQLCGQS